MGRAQRPTLLDLPEEVAQLYVFFFLAPMDTEVNTTYPDHFTYSHFLCTRFTRLITVAKPESSACLNDFYLK